MEKNAAKNQRFLDFPCPIPTTVQKGSASNRLYVSPRCRSRVPRGGALLRRGRRPRRPASAHRRVPAYSRLSLRRGRRPRRPVARSLIAGCTRVLHVCLRRPYFFQQRKKYGKERRQKPTVFGFPLSDSDHGTKRFRIESLVRLSPLPLPCSAQKLFSLVLYGKSTLHFLYIFISLRPNGPHLHLPPMAASARFDNRSNR